MEGVIKIVFDLHYYNTECIMENWVHERSTAQNRFLLSELEL